MDIGPTFTAIARADALIPKLLRRLRIATPVSTRSTTTAVRVMMNGLCCLISLIPEFLLVFFAEL